MNSPKNNHHIVEMDYLRGLAILLVISVLVSSIFTEMDTITFLSFLYLSIHSFSHVSVSLFVFISGFVLFLNYQKNFSILTFYKKRFLSVVPPYLIFSTLYLGFFMCLVYLNPAYQTGPVSFSLQDIVLDYLTGDAAVQLWFLVLIIQLYILYPVLAYFCQTVFPSKIKTAVFLCILFLIAFFYQSKVFVSQNFENVVGFYDFWHTGLIFLEFLFYFILGMYIASDYNNFKDYIHKISLKTFLIPLVLFNILGIIFYVGLGFPGKSGEYVSLITIGSRIFLFFKPVFYLIIFLILFVFILNLNETEFFSKCLKRIGVFSYGIFLIEVFFLTLLTIILEKFNFSPYNYLYFPIVFLCTLLLSIVSIMLIRKLPYSQYIVGKIQD